MEREERKLEFYGGEWMSLAPMFLFIILIFVTTFLWGSISDGALWVPIFRDWSSRFSWQRIKSITAVA